MKKRIFKILKITGIVFVSLFLLLLIAGWVITYFYKDDIKAMADKAIAESVNAEVNYDIHELGVSFIRNFPNLSIYQGKVSVVGKDEFKGDTLVSLKSVRVTINLWSVLFGSQMQIRGIYVDTPRFFGKVLRNGKANWDITKATPEDTTKKPEEEKPTKFDIGIRWWQVDNATIVYDDRSMGFYTRLDDLEHYGSGNFNQDIFDLNTNTEIQKITMRYGGDAYLEDKYFALDMVLNMNMPESKYTFKRNTVKINDFSFGFDGFVQLLKDKVAMDISYTAKENLFKNILSLVPGMFTKDFDKLKTDGKIKFSGFVRGDYPYNGSKMPGFGVDLEVADGMFQYPALPAAVSNINMGLMITCKDGVIDNTLIDLRKFHMDLGKNPIDARARIEKLTNSKIDANAKAKVNLSDMTQMFPMPTGYILKGTYVLDLTAKGIYNATQMPAIHADMSLINGYAKTAQYPDALEDMHFVASLKNPSGKFSDFRFLLQDFKMVLDKEAFEASGLVENFEDVTYNFKVKGGINLEKIAHIYPMEGTTLAGRIFADIQTAGRASYAINGQYEKLPTSGFVKINNFNYLSKDYLPQGFKITESNATFTPQNINLTQMDGFLGKSDIHAKGTIGNYIAYIFKPDGVLKGNFDFNSDRFDADEWMTAPALATTTAEGKTPAQSTTPTSTGVTVSTSGVSGSASTSAEIPRNIDFTLNATLKEVIYYKMPISDVKSLITIKDGIFKMENTTFNALGGGFKAGMLFNSQDLKRPKFAFDFGIDKLPLAKAALQFASAKGNEWMKNMVGDLSSLFKVSGTLDENLMPVLDKSMNGILNLDLKNTIFKDMPIAKSLSNFINTNDLKTINLKDILVRGEIKDGRVTYQPFDIQANQYKVNVKGSNALDGTMDFDLKMDVPTNKLSMLAKGSMATFLGKNVDAENVTMNFKLGGTYLDPKLNLVGSDGKIIGSVKDEVKEKVKEKVTEKLADKKDEAREKASAEAEKLMADAREKAEAIKDEARKQAEDIKKTADETHKKIGDEAYKKAYDKAPAFKEPAGNKARQLAEKSAKPAKDEAYKRADQLVSEADKKAEQILTEAQKRADKLKAP